MKWLITGANGVVGKNLYKILEGKYGCEVFGVGRSESNLSNYLKADLLNRKDCLRVFGSTSFDFVVHCAANLDMREPFSSYLDNVTLTSNVVESSIINGVEKIFHTSSIPIFKPTLELPITEMHPTEPPTTYHLSKLHSEGLIELLCKERMDYYNFRLPSPVGLGMPLRSILPIFIDKASRNETITLVGNPCRKQNFLDIRDLADLLYKASLRKTTSGVFNVAAKVPYSNFELAELIVSHLNSRSEIIDNMSKEGGDSQVWDISTQKAFECFGFRPEFELNDTLNWILKEL